MTILDVKAMYKQGRDDILVSLLAQTIHNVGIAGVLVKRNRCREYLSSHADPGAKSATDCLIAGV